MDNAAFRRGRRPRWRNAFQEEMPMKSANLDSTSRRELLIRAVNLAAAGAVLGPLSSLVRAADAKPIKVGFLYSASRDDYGFN